MIARTIFLYIVILFIFRVMGKREIGELSVLDLVVFIMIAEMAVMAIENPKDPLIHTMVPMFLLMGIQILLAYVSLKSRRFRNVIDGKPSVIINNGKIDEKVMKKQRYNFDDLLIQLRDKNVKNVADVEFAILEPSGKLSVFEKKQDEGTSPDEHQEEEGTLNLPLIMDGAIQEEHLKKINKTNLWLRQQLRSLGYKNFKNISFCSYNKGVFFIDLKDE
ncbi:membrane protein [Bacillus sp. LL01]|nr:membrane protein [Bacillus sp. LL01]